MFQVIKMGMKMNNREKMKEKIYSIRFKITLMVLCSFFLLAILNISIYFNVNNTINNIDTVYESNETLNKLIDTLSEMQDNVLLYVETKSSSALMDYYKYEQSFMEQVSV